jgi:hypothetical protein
VALCPKVPVAPGRSNEGVTGHSTSPSYELEVEDNDNKDSEEGDDRVENDPLLVHPVIKISTWRGRKLERPTYWRIIPLTVPDDLSMWTSAVPSWKEKTSVLSGAKHEDENTGNLP